MLTEWKRISEIRTELLEEIRAHELLAHAGEPCWATRAHVVGYLAHCLGIGRNFPSMSMAVGFSIAWHERHCVQGDCPHWSVDQAAAPDGQWLKEFMERLENSRP